MDQLHLPQDGDRFGLVWFGLVAGCCVNMVMNLAVK